MNVVGETDLEDYRAAGDPVLALLRTLEHEADRDLTSHRWLLDSEAKRMLYWRVYGDLLSERRGLSVLDVGGGYSSLTRLLAERHDYTTLELFAHDDEQRIAAIERDLGRFWVRGDWYAAQPARTYDVVIANDLFPNVDQRLSLFLDRYLPVCAELRLTLTYYNRPRFYETRRVDADEILFLLAWDGDQLARALERHRDRFDGPLDDLPRRLDSIFPNGRHVAVATLRGDRADAR